MINNLPTIFEVVTGAAKKQTKEKGPNSTNKNNKPSTNCKFRYFLCHLEVLLLMSTRQSLIACFVCSHQDRSLIQRPRRWWLPPRMKMITAKTMEKKRRKSATIPCVELVEQTMARMSSGSAAITASGGTMENVWRSRLLELSISSTRSAQTAATRGLGHNNDKHQRDLERNQRQRQIVNVCRYLFFLGKDGRSPSFD